MKTYTQYILILVCITLFFYSANAQGNQSYLTITNAPSTDTENGKVVFDNVAANAISWTWNRVIDGADVFSRTGGDTYSPARVGKFSLVYTISTNEAYRIPFSIEIENPSPCPNSTMTGDFNYFPEISNPNSTLPQQGKYLGNITGGSAPYTYSWFFGVSGLPLSEAYNVLNPNYGFVELPLSGGPSELVYLIVKDANGCSIVIKKEFTRPPAPNPPAPPVPGNGPDCTNLSLNPTSQTNETLTCDGSVQLNANGGLAPYNYSYSFNSQISIPTINSSFGNLCAGNYIFKVTDANGCNKELPVSILVNPCLNLKLKVNDHLEDEKDCNGFVSLIANGGTSPYLYSYTSISGSKTPSLISSFSNLCGGNYTFKVIDGNGCSKDSLITIKLLIPLPNDVTTDLSAGIEELKESKVQIYPNPFKENITILMKENSPTDVIITDLTGKVVFKDHIYSNNVNLNLSHLESGQYNLQLVNDLGVENQKIIK